MTFWLKEESGRNVRLKDSAWQAKIYAAGSACDSPEFILSRLKDSGFVSSVSLVKKRQSIFSSKQSEVLEIELSRPDKGKKVADLLESLFQNPSTFRLYNVDVSPEQQYFLENGLFPLAHVSAYSVGEQIARWSIDDNVWSTDYRIPQLKVMGLDVGLGDKVPRLDSKLAVITLTPSYYQEGDEEEAKERITIKHGEEAEILLEAAREIQKFDPDFVITSNGDAFVFPYLYSKAQRHSIEFEINRDPAAQGGRRKNSKSTNNTQIGGRTYFSYGRIMYKPSTHRLYGRIHVDGQNTFVYDQCRFEGLFEIARISRMPFHASSRASIGKSLSGLQFYHAFQRDTLIPYKPVISEEVKTMSELLVADRGGLVFVPLPGVHEQVCELDFASLYPSIIKQRNISAETVNCPCCPDSDNRIEELNMHMCKAKVGIVPESLVLPLEKRFLYKRMRDETNVKRLKQAYNERAGALKWVLVTSFGYLSFRHAKFMKIDAHIAVCSVARDTLLNAMHTAENRGFRVIHGIVDSLWIRKDRAKLEDYKEVCDEIVSATKYRLAIEGIYKWIVFLPSKVYSENQVANRYFGCFKSGEMKVRGIELRRHDTPVLFKRCQEEILQELAKCDNEQELRNCARNEGRVIFERYARDIERHDVSSLDLLIRRRLSKSIEDYSSKRQIQVNAASELNKAGLKLQAGQTIAYVITKYRSAGQNRSVPEELVEEETAYDSERYVELLADVCATVLSPFGIDKGNLLSRSHSLLAWS
jgi:DNA polymerase elongation subunit (family B)